VLVAGFPSLATATNCWVVAPGDGEQCLIIDPGLGVTDAVDDLIREHRLHPVAVLLTHGHYDHTFSVLPICQARDVPAYIHPDDREQLSDPWTWAGLAPGSPIMGVSGATIAEPDDLRLLADGEQLEVGGVQLAVRHTPGHSRGSVVFGSNGSSTVDGRSVLFSGDVLFAGSIGRTDLRGGSMPQMLQSLRDVVLPMDDDVVVAPGHGPSTTIGRERATNPFLLELIEPR
jgi:glyoxylase-like metal-dependent hydrolase (beta-lactamase superfamily II)